MKLCARTPSRATKTSAAARSSPGARKGCARGRRRRRRHTPSGRASRARRRRLARGGSVGGGERFHCSGWLPLPEASPRRGAQATRTAACRRSAGVGAVAGDPGENLRVGERRGGARTPLSSASPIVDAGSRSANRPMTRSISRMTAPPRRGTSARPSPRVARRSRVRSPAVRHPQGVARPQRAPSGQRRS